MTSPAQDADSRTLVLYGTEHCHLCEEAILVLQALPALHAWLLEWVDIATDDALLEVHATSIPVLAWPAGNRQLGWPFTGDDVLRMVGLPAGQADLAP